MSRTDAHKPYWVRQREAISAVESRESYHYHQPFGKPVQHYVTERDANGYPVVETVIVPVYLYERIQVASQLHNSTDGFKTVTECYIAAGFFTLKGEEDWFKKVTRHRRVMKTVGYFADRCTCNEPVNREGKTVDGYFAACRSYLPRYIERKIYPQSSSVVSDRKSNARGNRKNISDKLKAEIKKFNSYEDVEDEGYVMFESIHKPARQKYWD